MPRTPMLLALTLAVPMGALAGTATLLQPSQATRPGAPPPAVSVSLNDQAIAMSLSDAIYLALRDNRVIRSAYLNRIAQKFDLRVAEDRFTPKLVLSGSYLADRSTQDQYRQGTVNPQALWLTPYGTRVSLGWAYRHTQAGQAGPSWHDGADISLIQPLMRGAGEDMATAPVRLARLLEQANRLTLKATVSQTITQVITSYRALLQAQEQLRIARESLERARQLIEVNHAMIKAGRMAEFEIVQTQADVATQELAYEESRNQLDTARLALLQLLALDLHTPLVATEALKAQRVNVDAEQALAQAQASQPAYLTQLIASEQADITMKVASNDRLWDVSLIAGASQIRDRNAYAGSARAWENYAGVQVEIPLGDLSARQAQVKAEVNLRTQAIQLAQARQQLKQDVTNAVRAIDSRWRQYEIAQRARDLSRRKLSLEREKLTVGRSSNFQVLSFENDLRNVENARINALISYLNAQAELDQTLGTTLQSWDITLNG